MTAPELADSTIATLAPLLRTRLLSPVELTEAVLENIGRLNASLNAFITTLPEQAHDAASRAEAEIIHGTYRGPLHGIPIAHKDVIATRAVRTTAHSRVLAEHVPTSDATVVQRLSHQGAILVGKTNTYEFACGATEHFGVPVNPWNTRRTTGGSSAGSAAAVAGALCLGATGTDTGGSIRSPASYCGVVGLKPTYGRVSRTGVLPVSWSLDHVGPLARSVRDAAYLLDAMAGFDPSDPSSCPQQGPPFGDMEWDSADFRRLDDLRIGIPWESLEHVDAEVRHLFERAARALEGLGARLVTIRIPGTVLTSVALQGVMAPEATRAHHGWLRSRAREYVPFTRQKLLLGACMGAGEYLLAQQVRHAIVQEFGDSFRDVDAMVWPTVACVAPPVDEPEVPTGVQTRLTNLTANPSLSVPCGFSQEGLPVGMQINGRLFDEATILRIGHAYEASTESATRRPDLSTLAAPPRSKPYPTPRRPPDASPSETAAAEDSVVAGLRQSGLPLLEEDLEALVNALLAFRGDLRRIDLGAELELEPIVHTHVTSVRNRPERASADATEP